MGINPNCQSVHLMYLQSPFIVFKPSHAALRVLLVDGNLCFSRVLHLGHSSPVR